MVTLGGSISAGQGVTVSSDAYIPRIYEWVSSVFPHKNHRWEALVTEHLFLAFLTPHITRVVRT